MTSFILEEKLHIHVPSSAPLGRQNWKEYTDIPEMFVMHLIGHCCTSIAMRMVSGTSGLSRTGGQGKRGGLWGKAPEAAVTGV